MKLAWIKLNFKFLLKKSGTFVGILYSVLGFIATWCSLENILPLNTTTWYKIAISTLILLAIALTSFIGTVIWYYYNNTISVIEKGNGKKVYVRYGDFIKELKQVRDSRINFIIPSNRCFDTIVDDKIISSNTIQGQFLKHIYSINAFSPNGLSSAIERSLTKISKVRLSAEEKPAGHKDRYPIGTIADIDGHNSHYYLLGLSEFDRDLTAHISKEDFVIAIQRMIEYCNKHSQGHPVILPLIGSGLSRTNINKNEVLRYLVRAFEINKDIINCDFHIVVWEQDKEEIAITNLK